MYTVFICRINRNCLSAASFPFKSVAGCNTPPSAVMLKPKAKLPSAWIIKIALNKKVVAHVQIGGIIIKDIFGANVIATNSFIKG